ncbi:hypothetical protein Q9R19_02410 [Microbacterium sp. ARD32]|uniref:hypothetical protein n=1 Tax=Microbacterium sp. ARD32 TaxID=2962577 RepID=UPI002882AD5F|nr:hypothetical protein [Microbacterium sp. ARD32]MDT0156471.1 hypothetical protein [Microbacterium sp. ARD32]
MRPSRLPHLLRGLSTATIATFTALLGHVSAGGAMPGVIGIVVPLVLSSMVSVLLAGRRLSLTRLMLAVSASQFFFHTLFILGAVTPAGLTGGHQHGMAMILPATDALPIVTPDAMMWFGHAVAAVLTALALHRGETLLSALVHIAGVIATWVVAVFRAAVRLQPRRSVSRPAAHGPRTDDTGIRIVRQQPRRGPPRLSSI